MVNQDMKKSLWSLVVLGLLSQTGCGPTHRGGKGLTDTQGLDQNRFLSLLENGKRVSYQKGSLSASGLYAAPATDSMNALSIEFMAGSLWVEWAQWDTTQQDPLNSEQLPVEALAMIERFRDQLGVSASELKPSVQDTVNINDTLIVLNFDRFVDGLPVRDAYVQVFFSQDQDGFFRLREIVNRSGGKLETSNKGEAAPTFNNLQEILGRTDLMGLQENEIIFTRGLPEGGLETLMATEFVVDDPQSDDRYTITVSHGDGTVLEAFSHKFSADKIPVSADVYERNYLEGKFTSKSFPLASIAINGTTVVTDLDGLVDGGVKGNGTATLRSQRVNIFNDKGTTPLTVPVVLDSTGKTAAATDDQIRALDAYMSAHRINKFVRRQISPSEVAFLDRVTPVKINVAGNCNAFYSGADRSVNLFAAGNGCANLAIVNDVLYHEWGHALDDNTGRQVGITDGAFSEGIGDILSSYYTNSPNMAPGFFVNSDRGIRQLQNQKKYPNDVTNEVHADGLIIGGAFWDLHVALVGRYGNVKGSYMAENYFLRHLLTTDAFMDSYRAVVRLDDDDGNPNTPSPNECLINKAFATHGLATASNCEDKVATETVPIDASIYLAVKSETNGLATLMAASEKAAQFGLCLGDRKTCLTSGKIDVEFTAEGVSADKSRAFFVASKDVALTDLALVTGIAKDSNGKIIGAKSMKIITK